MRPMLSQATPSSWLRPRQWLRSRSAAQVYGICLVLAAILAALVS